MNKNFIKENRIGMFTINTDLLYKDTDVDELLAVMKKVVVVRAEHLYSVKKFIYHAYSPLFDIVEPTVETPLYDFVITHNSKGKITKVRAVKAVKG